MMILQCVRRRVQLVSVLVLIVYSLQSVRGSAASSPSENGSNTGKWWKRIIDSSRLPPTELSISSRATELSINGSVKKVTKSAEEIEKEEEAKRREIIEKLHQSIVNNSNNKKAATKTSDKIVGDDEAAVLTTAFGIKDEYVSKTEEEETSTIATSSKEESESESESKSEDLTKDNGSMSAEMDTILLKQSSPQHVQSVARIGEITEKEQKQQSEDNDSTSEDTQQQKKNSARFHDDEPIVIEDENDNSPRDKHVKKKKKTGSKGRLISPKRVVNLALTGVQAGLSVYLCKIGWKAIVDVWEELEQDLQNSSSNSMREDHDMPFLNDDVVDSIVPSSDDDTAVTEHSDGREPVREEKEAGGTTSAAENLRKKMEKKSTPRQGAAITSNLAKRLHAAGLPMSSPNDSDETDKPKIKTVKSVLKSLTRTEGQLLSSTLLSPIDTEEDGVIMGNPNRNKRVIEMWNEIGGLEEVKESLLDLVFPMLFDPQYNNNDQNGMNNNDMSYYGGLLSNPPGVLLYGPPGCGKTMLVRALAHTSNARFLCVTPSSLLRKYVGETNLNVRALFSIAKKISPCIIFIDEMEGLFRERGGGGSGDEHEVNRELKTEFMQLWEGIQNQNSRGNDLVLVVGATNRPFDVDAAFLRRMPRSFFVGLPDFRSRVSILNTMLSTVPLAKDFNVETLANMTEDYSPSDLKELLRTAALFPLREARTKAMQNQAQMQQSQMSPTIGIPPLRPLSTADVLQARARVAPTQFSANYRMALSEYAEKASGGGTRHLTDHVERESGNTKENPDTAYHHGGDGVFYTDASTVPNEQNESIQTSYSFEDESDEYDFSSYSDSED